MSDADPFEGLTPEQAWNEGHDVASKDAEELIDQKDAFIERQSGIIQDCMAAFDQLQAWDKVPYPLRVALADYV